jgi:hypothetical protein
MTYNHRDFWQSGHGAKGLDRSILTTGDVIEFDNGAQYPWYATPVYGRPAVCCFPMRELTVSQALAVEAARRSSYCGSTKPLNFTGQTKDGTVHAFVGYGQYQPRTVDIATDGSIVWGD